MLTNEYGEDISVEEFLLQDSKHLPPQGSLEAITICQQTSNTIFKDRRLLIKWCKTLASNYHLKHGLFQYVFRQPTVALGTKIDFMKIVLEQLSDMTDETNEKDKHLCASDIKIVFDCYFRYLHIVSNDGTPSLSQVFQLQDTKQQIKEATYGKTDIIAVINWIDCPKLFQEICLIDEDISRNANMLCFGYNILAYKLCTMVKWDDTNFIFRFSSFKDHMQMLQVIMDKAKEDSTSIYATLPVNRALLIVSKFSITNRIFDVWMENMDKLKMQDDITQLFIVKRFIDMYKIPIQETFSKMPALLNNLSRERRAWINAISDHTVLVKDVASIVYDYWPISKPDDQGTSENTNYKGYRM